MIASQCVSITDLKKNASRLVKSLKRDGHKIIFVNNKPVAILSDIDNFQMRVDEVFDFDFWPDGVDPQVILDGLGS